MLSILFTPRPVALLLTVVFLFSNGCSFIEDKGTEFHFLGKAALQSDMRRMAVSLRAISDMTAAPTDSAITVQQRVMLELDRVDSIASSLGGEGITTNYSVIDRYMGALLYDIQLAKEFSLHDPPNYVPANRLLNSCLSCHQSL